MCGAFRLMRTTLGIAALSMISLSGCNRDEAVDAMRSAEETAKSTADAVAQGAGETLKEGEAMASQAAEEGKKQADQAVEKGKQMASDLSDKAMAFLNPLKEKLSNLDELKDSPEKLKTAVDDLIETIESKAEGITLPESMSNAVATIKEKLVALKEYLEGEVEQAKIDEKIAEITDTVKNKLSMSDK
ncbi:hypothetical protein FYK55_02530 [Roseiconus nitratireducens]|uniref:Uncharacterized protein n=1 Tax=Roseiconus nitratireducens TaxID=2605748 RepID=A0A5M6DIH6_9BACT|nr:hypothetical protein [Roseiconus nitratireducens]KAA5547291.1 hypothetical protein FYK55_02530 [Roseiconus nitratireducens]